MLKGKFYIFLIGIFLIGMGCARATSRNGFTVHEKSYYTSMKTDLTKDDNDGIFFAMAAYKKHPDKEDLFQLCIGSYVCGNAAVREFMEEELDGIGNINIIGVAKAVNSGRYGW
jgi:hypothetical protein